METQKPVVKNPAVGSWLRVEFDDEGKLSIRASFTAEQKENGKEVRTTRHEDITDQLGPDTKAKLVALFTAVLDEVTQSLSAKVAIDQVEYLLRNSKGDPRNKKIQLAAGNVEFTAEADNRKL